WILFQSQSGSRESHSGAVAGESANEVRPLGLYVDASGPTWRVSWNPAATALRGARAVALFVRDGEDQTRIDLTPQDLSSGTYSYQPRGQDVTFRLEVNDSAGRLSAESFRTMKAAPAAPAPPPAPAAPISPPKAIHKVPPVVPASIRPRIKGAIPIDVRVHVDTKGRVIAAAPVTKPHAGLQAYLAERAVYAAKAWRFEPARQNG